MECFVWVWMSCRPITACMNSAWLCVYVGGGLCISMCAAAAHAIRQLISFCLYQQGRSSSSNPHVYCLFWSPLPFQAASSSCRPKLEPNSFAKHNSVGWKWSRLATKASSLGCGTQPAVCYSVAWENPQKKTSVSFSHLFQLVGWWRAQCRLVKTLSHKAKEVCFLSAMALFLPLASLFHLLTVHTNTMVEFVFLETSTRLWRILIKCSQNAHTNTHPHIIRLTFSLYSNTGTHEVPKTACEHAQALVYCHSASERQGEVGGQNIAESVNYKTLWTLCNKSRTKTQL